MSNDQTVDDILAEMEARKHWSTGNAKQTARIERIKQKLLNTEYRQKHGFPAYELKRFEAYQYGDAAPVYMIIEVGMVGDENTLAEAFCRNYRHIVIGKNGGLELLNGKRPSYRYGFHNAVYELTK